MKPSEMSRMQNFVSANYGRYLVCKIGKGLIALPWFPIASLLVLIIAIMYAIYFGLKCFCDEFILEAPGMWKDYWSKNWFSGYSKARWKSIYRKPEVQWNVSEL